MFRRQPFLLFSDARGKIYSHPYLRMAGSGFGSYAVADKQEIMKMPSGSSLFYLPQRAPVGYDPAAKKFEVAETFKGKKIYAVAAFPVPAILRLYNPAAVTLKQERLPLWAYTACGFYGGAYYITAARIDKRLRQSPRFYDNSLIKKNVLKTLKDYPANRLYRHLAHCALNYNCLAAKNLFLCRWEAPLPTAGACNARCLGCLSQQCGASVASHSRISFTPDVKEISQVMVNHLVTAPEAIVSFGQGCEGEPLTQAEVIIKAVEAVRGTTGRGTINMNTNASYPHKIKALALAGVDSFRVSLNSVSQKHYNMYFRPKNYCFEDVVRSIKIAKKLKKFVSINLFVFPGFTDSRQEAKRLISFIDKTRIDMIQWRNLNIDPDYYIKQFKGKSFSSGGMLALLDLVRKKYPRLKFGYFNLPKEQF